MEWNGIWFNSYASNRNKTLVGQYYLWWNTAVPQIPYFTTAVALFFLEKENFIDFKHNTAVALIPDLQSFGGRLQPAVDS